MKTTAELEAEAKRIEALSRSAFHNDPNALTNPAPATLELMKQAREANKAAHLARCADYKARMAAR